MNFGQNLKYYREQNNMTQKELSAKIGKSIRSISYYENQEGDKNIPDTETLERIARAFKISINELLGIDNNDTQENILIDALEEKTMANELEWISYEALQPLIEEETLNFRMNLDNRYLENTDIKNSIEEMMTFLEYEIDNFANIFYCVIGGDEYVLGKFKNSYKNENNLVLILNPTNENKVLSIHGDESRESLSSLYDSIRTRYDRSYNSILSNLIARLENHGK